MDIKFCTQCGKPLTYKAIGDEGEQKYCADCDKSYFDNPASCVHVAIVNENKQVLLLKQIISPQGITHSVQGICTRVTRLKKPLPVRYLRKQDSVCFPASMCKAIIAHRKI